jgi:hypothetical protein
MLTIPKADHDELPLIQRSNPTASNFHMHDAFLMPKAIGSLIKDAIGLEHYFGISLVPLMWRAS